MKTLLAIPLSWLCYYLGDFVSRTFDYSEFCAKHLYSTYNKLMGASIDLQLWVNGKPPKFPWGEPE